MCGIAGVLTRPGRHPTPGVLRAMADALVHRGPDRQAVLSEGPLGLAASRLAIIDPGQSGDQPVSDGRQALVFNGEIYNHDELRAELVAHGSVLRGRSDTEVLFCALNRWGLAVLPRLEGMFVFAWADLRDHTVWLARDRLGIKPLVWRRQAGEALAFASEAKALLPTGPLEVEPLQAFFGAAGRVERSATLTPFRDVHQVPPGHVLRLRPDQSVRAETWWSLEDLVDEGLHRELAACRRDEQAERLDALLTASVTRMAVADRPVGVFLSGGVDSTLIADYASEVGVTRLLAADVGGERSEAGAAHDAARHLGGDLTVTHVPHDALLHDWAGATWHVEAPLVTHVNGVAFGRLARDAHASDLRVVLSGEGADELFSGYPEIAARPYLRALRAPTTAATWLARQLPDPWRRMQIGRQHSTAEVLGGLVGHFTESRLRARGTQAFGFLPPRAAACQGEVFSWLGVHLVTLLRRNDAMGMAASVEARFPYLDEEVVRFGVNLPTRSKVVLDRRVGDPKHPFLRDKAVLRQVAEARLPRSVACRPKLGFPVYGHDRLRVDPTFWRDGYVAELIRAPGRDGLGDAVAGTVGDYDLAKLASVEVFGRLFARAESFTDVTDHVQAHIKVTP